MHLRKNFVMMRIELEYNYVKGMTIEGGRHEDRCLYKTGAGYESGRN